MLMRMNIRPTVEAGALGLLAAAALAALSSCGDAGASPAQPLPFPHRPHTENQIDCAFCHEFADSYAAAGMPETELCGNCHLAMPNESEATAKLLEFVEAEEPIPWVRLYQLPQFTYFSHQWHTGAGIECTTCHGDIGTSLTAVRHIDLEMAWCVECHEQNDASVDCVTCHK